MMAGHQLLQISATFSLSEIPSVTTLSPPHGCALLPFPEKSIIIGLSAHLRACPFKFARSVLLVIHWLDLPRRTWRRLTRPSHRRGAEQDSEIRSFLFFRAIIGRSVPAATLRASVTKSACEIRLNLG
jgi:hypothetical protein